MCRSNRDASSFDDSIDCEVLRIPGNLLTEDPRIPLGPSQLVARMCLVQGLNSREVGHGGFPDANSARASAFRWKRSRADVEGHEVDVSRTTIDSVAPDVSTRPEGGDSDPEFLEPVVGAVHQLPDVSFAPHARKRTDRLEATNRL